MEKIETAINKSVTCQWSEFLSRLRLELRDCKVNYSLYAEHLMRAYVRLSYALKVNNVKMANKERSWLMEAYLSEMSPIDLSDGVVTAKHREFFADVFRIYKAEPNIRNIFNLELFQFHPSDDDEEEITEFGLRHYSEFYAALESYDVKRVNDFLKGLKYEKQERKDNSIIR